MAELAVSIAGLTLAWKGIIDFGELVFGLMDDDVRHREILSLRLEVSQHALKDWGDHWGVTCSEGRFHAFEKSRKELIMRVIFKLHESRQKATKRMKNYYSVDEDNIDHLGKPTSTLLNKFKVAAKRGRDKGLWIVHDRVLITELVDETDTLLECLNTLTCVSLHFLLNNMETFRTASALERKFEELANTAGHVSQTPNEPTNSPSDPRPRECEVQLDRKTIIGFTAKSIKSSWQAEQVRDYLDSAFHRHCDSRIPEAIAVWWNDPSSKTLVLELPDNMISTYSCVLLYHLAACEKIIYICDPKSSVTTIRHMVDMLRYQIHSLLSLRGNQPLGSAIPPCATETENSPVDTETLQSLIDFFFGLLHGVLTSSNIQVLLIFDGFEIFDSGHDQSEVLIRAFVSGLCKVCNEIDHSRQQTLKILITYRGYARIFYDCVGDQDTVDLTSYSSRMTVLREALASSLRGAVIENV